MRQNIHIQTDDKAGVQDETFCDTQKWIQEAMFVAQASAHHTNNLSKLHSRASRVFYPFDLLCQDTLYHIE